MVNRVLKYANRSLTITMAAAILSGGYLISGVFGLLRDRLLAAEFGISGTLDAYFAAFSLPDLLFFILVSGALVVTLLPVLNERLQHHNKKSAWEIASSVINILAILTLVASILIFVFASSIIDLIAPNFDVTRHETAVNIMRILALNPFFFSLSSVFGTIQQAFGRFFFFALAPIIYNLGIIFGIVYLSDSFGIYGVAYGVVIGAIAQMLIQILGMQGLGFTYKPHIFWRNKGFRKVIRLIIPRSIDEGIEHLIALIERAIASGLTTGAIASYQFAFSLKNYPITLIGTAIATAAFPSISSRALGTRTDLLKKEILEVARAILWFAIPAAAGIVIMRGYIVRLLLGFGDATVANILGWFTVAIVFQSLLRLVTRIFYAQQDTKTPLYASIVAIVLNISLALWLAHTYGVVGLAMAQSIVAVIEVSYLFVVLIKRLGWFFNKTFLAHVIKTGISAFVMACVTYVLVRFVFPLVAGETGFFALAPKFSAIVLISLTVYLAAGWVLRLPEAVNISKRIKRFMFTRVPLG
ncbi:murein biosynthesis integral membrane protein MurJ [Candidatus Saccharibacteria bacterium QS_5_54_17]|nr:MAG: murein biosynthesis integral membrane protein MurJ [Candidatus Saccharibacteria bacterium QS_5_54_17]